MADKKKMSVADILAAARKADSGSENEAAAADAAAAQGKTPTVLLLAIGSVADSTARATFAKNFFEAGGVLALLAAAPEVILFLPSVAG